MTLKAAVLAVALLFAGTAAAATLYTDDGTPANRVSVADVSPLEGALALGEPLWLPAGQYTLPSNYQLTGTVDLACESGAEITLSGSNFISNGAGTFKARGCTIIGDGNDALVSLNSATVLPALIDIQDSTLIGVAEVNWSEWTIEPNGMIGELILKRNTLDMLGIGRGTYIQNGVKRTTIEDYEVRNYVRFGLMVAVHGNFPAQQQYVEWGRFANIRILNGKGGGSSATNSNGLYLGGRRYVVDGLHIEGFRPPLNAQGVPQWSQDGDEAAYFKVDDLELRNFYITDVPAFVTIKGQTWDQSSGPGPVGGNVLVENGQMIRAPGDPYGGIGVLDQTRGAVYRKIKTVGLWNSALLTHQTSGATLVQTWDDSGREPGSISDNGKGVFTQRSDIAAMTILGSSVQPEFLARAVKAAPGRIINDDYNNNWLP